MCACMHARASRYIQEDLHAYSYKERDRLCGTGKQLSFICIRITIVNTDPCMQCTTIYHHVTSLYS